MLEHGIQLKGFHLGLRAVYRVSQLHMERLMAIQSVFKTKESDCEKFVIINVN
jgi:hypothetical protein